MSDVIEYQDHIQTEKLWEDFSLKTIPSALSCQIDMLIIVNNCRDEGFRQPECLEERRKDINHSLIILVSGKHLFMFCCNR